jgi:hypothetical protein
MSAKENAKLNIQVILISLPIAALIAIGIYLTNPEDLPEVLLGFVGGHALISVIFWYMWALYKTGLID